MAQTLYSFRESPEFTKRIVDFLPDDDYAKLQRLLQEDPEAGALIVGGKGLRKVRYGAAGRGKRGGLRVIYYWADQRGYIYLATVYAKNAQSDITPKEALRLRGLVQEWLNE